MPKTGRHMTARRFADELAEAGVVIDEWIGDYVFRAHRGSRSATVCFRGDNRWRYAVASDGRVIRSMDDVRSYLADGAR